jgi:hypothetical protein
LETSLADVRDRGGGGGGGGGRFADSSTPHRFVAWRNESCILIVR